jgi:hypothetical protein
VGGESVINDRRLSWILLLVLSIALVYGTWILPFRFPPRQFVIGASYEVGFNNGVSFLVYLICVPLMAFVTGGLLQVQRGVNPRQAGSGRLADKVAAVVIASHVALFAALYAYKGRFVFGESLYFQSLLYRMSTGEVPYVDFSFYYGPLMLYPSYWLSRVAGLDLAYGIWFIATYVVGLIFLYVALRVILVQERTRAFWFVLLALGLFNPLTGVNVTFTRYLFPSMVFLAAAGFVLRGGRARGALASALLAAAVAYSFEVAALSIGAVVLVWFAFAFGTLMLRMAGLARGHSQVPPASVSTVRAIALLAIGGCLSAAFFLFVDPTGQGLRTYPAIAESYSGGAHNVPIYPHLPFIALAAITVVTLAIVVRLAWRGLGDEVTLGVAAYSLVALMAQRAAFGAAEPSHFAFFGLPMFCLALYMSGFLSDPQAARTCLAAVLVVGIVLPMQYYHAMEFVPFFTHRLNAGTEALEGTSVADAPSRTLEQNLRDVVEAVGTTHPYLMYEMEYSSLPVYRDFGLRYATYYTMLINARDTAGVNTVIDDVRHHQAIVVARARDLHGLEPPPRSRAVVRLLDLLSGAHTAGSDLNAVLMKSRSRLTDPFLAFIRREYIPVYERNGLMAFAPR